LNRPAFVPRKSFRPLARLGSGVLDAFPEAVRRNLPGWRVVVGWAAIVSRDVASRSQAVSFRDGCLTVQVVSSVWMHHLMALKRQMLVDLNRATGAQGDAAGPIRDIHFVLNPRAGAPPESNRPQGAEG
jgi:hypothetical protein